MGRIRIKLIDVCMLGAFAGAWVADIGPRYVALGFGISVIATAIAVWDAIRHA